MNKIIKYGFFIQVFGFVLLFYVGIILTLVKIYDKIGTVTFLIIYWGYVAYVLLFIIVSSGRETRMFNKDFNESEELLKLRMNHALTVSIPIITFAISIFLAYSFSQHPFLWLGGLLLFAYSMIYFISGYYLRYRELDQIERVKEMMRVQNKRKVTKNGE